MNWRSGRMSARADVIVLGAGIVGVSVALHLQKRDRDVVLIDRQRAGEETSYGNAGLIQREAVIPYTFPREFSVILSYAMNNRRDAVYHLSALRRIVHYRGWLNCCRTEQSLHKAMADARRLDNYGVDYAVLTARQLRELEPHISEKIVGAI